MASEPPNPARDSASPHDSRSPSPSGCDVLTLRALVSTNDADVIIGMDGTNVLREQTGVEADVSEVTREMHDECILSVSGSVESVTKAYALIIAQHVDANPSSPTVSTSSAAHASIRLLVSHARMGAIIGRNGRKIKAIQDGSGAQIVASRQTLPQFAERVIDVQGSPEAIGRAIEEIGRCLLEDSTRGIGTVLSNPGAADEQSSGQRSHGRRRRLKGGSNARAAASPSTAGNPTDLHTQTISIPSDMVGCIIGRGGSKINETRRLSGSKISIAKEPHDETGERMFTIVGTPEANEKALFLLHNQLRKEQDRRVRNKQQNKEEDFQD